MTPPENRDMGRRVLKYPIPVQDDFTVQMPAGSIVVAVQAQRGEPFFWADVDAAQPYESRRFFLRGTGHLVPDDAHYLGTFQLSDGDFIGHLYEP